jgi:hypothetical protein
LKVEIGPYPKGGEERIIDIHIDGYDLINADHTMALVIHSMMLAYQKRPGGSPYVADEDVIEDIGNDVHVRWRWVISEIVYAFGEVVNDCVVDDDARIQNGINLFAKYFRGIWT